MSSSADSTPAGSTSAGSAAADEPSADSTSVGPAAAEAGAVPTPVQAATVSDWDGFEERPLPAGLGGPEQPDPVSPGREMAALLQRYWADLQSESNRVQKESAAARKILTELAVHVARLDGLLREAADPLEAAGAKTLGRRLHVARKQVLEPLHAMDITTQDPTGKPYESVADVVDIAGWRYGPEFTAEVVAETVEPIVLDRGTVVRLGQVIMGAPLSAGTENDA
ncbi:hypothetical protein [Streptomyces sp. NBC_00038]|uniref:hypothetical protein n=1 Tax=Streptomyces sp. NBC_00038 TaxID=2903615 RepID=UPI00225BC0DC|nr:hypothetical protein [Streptomyces sp. NBC_00038]MCX5560920.1 hypothetical protein [Streptomyces sp. NBC_00038]